MNCMLKVIVVVGATLVSTPAAAQLAVPPPRPHEVIDANGVNIVSGGFSTPMGAVSVGPDTGGLANAVTYATDSGFRHSIAGGLALQVTPSLTRLYTVTIPSGVYVFRRTGDGSYSLWRGAGGKLSYADGVYTFVARDGSVARFFKALNASVMGLANEAGLSSLEMPNGERWDYHYNGASFGDRVLQSVTNNRGYQIHFQYNGLVLFKVEAINNAIDACAPLATICATSLRWPSLTFNEHNVTDELGRTSRLIHTGNLLVGVASPSRASGQSLTLTWDASLAAVKTVSNGAGTWVYDINPPGEALPRMVTNTVTDPLGHTSSAEVNWSWIDPPDGPVDGLVMAVTDARGRRTTYGYALGGQLGSVTSPEGDIRSWSYTRGNLRSWNHTAKPGSSGGAVGGYFDYGDCSTDTLCGRPTSVTDARGGVTDYTYDAAGNLLTVTGPAPTPGAPRPQTRYQWEQRYAWYKQNGSSAITQAASPVWVQVGSSQCMTGATC